MVKRLEVVFKLISYYLCSIDAFPADESLPIDNILANAYIYGDLDFGGVCRKILAYPQGDQARAKGLENSQVFRCGGDSNDIEIPQALVPVGFKTCLLAGEIDILKFKESLIHSTFVLQLHTDDLCERVFTAAHVSAYNKSHTASVDPSPRQEISPKGILRFDTRPCVLCMVPNLSHVLSFYSFSERG